MSVNVRLPETLVDQARRHGNAQQSSVGKQIEYW